MKKRAENIKMIVCDEVVVTAQFAVLLERQECVSCVLNCLQQLLVHMNGKVPHCAKQMFSRSLPATLPSVPQL